MTAASNQVALAVLGAGVIGRKHMRRIHDSGQARLAAICDVDPSVEAGRVPRFTDLHRMLAGGGLDGVVVATPNELHADHAVACIEAGLHVLVEKPLAASIAEAGRMVAAAARHGRHILVGQYRRFNGQVTAARALVQGGALGRLTAISGIFTAKKPDDYYQVGWRTLPDSGGPVLINMIHDLDCLRYICGEIETVSAMTSNGARGLAVEDTAAVTLRFAGGALGTMMLSDATPSPWSFEAVTHENPDFFHTDENCYQILGTAGALAFPRLRLWRYADRVRASWDHPLPHQDRPAAPGDPLAEQIAHFCRVIRGEEVPRTDGRDGARTLACTLAVRESSRLGRPVAPARLGPAGEVIAGD